MARFSPPRLVGFDAALRFIEGLHLPGAAMVIGLDQPTIVPNARGSRPVERLAGSLVSWLGGGVQPSSRARTGMFCDTAPLWPFIARLGAVQDPEAARGASSGRFLLEVFPALALPSLDARFFGRKLAPKYNPALSAKFSIDAWRTVAAAVARRFEAMAQAAAAAWCVQAGALDRPRKADQDMLDAMICLAVVMHWRLAPRDASILLGDERSGYIVAPASPQVRARLAGRAADFGVPLDRFR